MTFGVQNNSEVQQVPVSKKLWQRPNPINATIVSVQRKAIYSHQEQNIPTDRRRIKCIVLNNTDKHFGVKFVKQPQDYTIALVVNDGMGSTQTVYVKLKELNDRWQLSEQEVQNYSDGQLQLYLNRINTVAILNNYQRIFKKQFTSNLRPKLMKVIKTAFLARQDNQYAETLNVLLTTHSIILGFNEADKISFCDWRSRERTRGGQLSDIYLMKSLFSKKKKILKCYPPTCPLKAGQEASIIFNIHKGYCNPLTRLPYVPGIQKPIYVTVCFSLKTDWDHLNYQSNLQHQYDGDLKKALGFIGNSWLPINEDWFGTFNRKLLAMLELFKGFHYAVKKKGLIHGDIALENIWVSGRDEQLHLYLGDFGSAMLANPEPPETLEKFNRDWTRKYILSKEASLRKSLHEEICQKGASPSLWLDYLNNGKQSDIFALGCVLAEVVAPHIVYMDYDSEGYPQPDSFEREALAKAGISEALCNLIGEMLQADASKRPDIDQVLKRFRKICKSARYEAYDELLQALKEAASSDAFTSIKNKPISNLKHIHCVHQTNDTLLNNPTLEVVEDLVQWASIDHMQGLLDACRSYLEAFEPSKQEKLKYFAICCRLNSLKGCDKVFDPIARQLSFKKYLELLIAFNEGVSKYPDTKEFLDAYIRQKLVVPFIKDAWDADKKFEAVCEAILILNPTLNWLFLPGLRIIIRQRLAKADAKFPKAYLFKTRLEKLQGHCSKGKGYYEEKNYDKALEEVSYALDIDPYETACLAIRGACYFMLGKKQLALANLKHATWTSLGHHALLKKQYQEAEAYYSAAIDITNAFSEPHLYRGYCYLMLEAQKPSWCRQRAFLDFSMVIKLEPKNPLGLSLRAECHMLEKNFLFALADLSKAIELGTKRHLDFVNRIACCAALNNKPMQGDEKKAAEYKDQNESRIPLPNFYLW